MDIGVIVCYRPTKSQLNIKVMLIRGHWRGGSYMVTLGRRVIYGNIGRRVTNDNIGVDGHIW